jgi:hypothetical protein
MIMREIKKDVRITPGSGWNGSSVEGHPLDAATADAARRAEIRGRLPLVNAPVSKGGVDTFIRAIIVRSALRVNRRNFSGGGAAFQTNSRRLKKALLLCLFTKPSLGIKMP